MPNVIVNIVGGTQKENTTAVTIGGKRWGLNGTAPFGKAQQIPEGQQELVVYKTADPKSISQNVDILSTTTTLNITVNVYTINVAVV